jgi:discs large protein 5
MSLILFFRVEGQLRLSGDSPDCDQTGRRGSTSARRSFFKRIKPQRSSSRDSKELASFSNTHLSLFLDPNSINEEIGVPSYQRVERLECEFDKKKKLNVHPLISCIVYR